MSEDSGAYAYEARRNLELSSTAPRFNDWMFSTVAPFLRGDILEVGSGLGVYSRRLFERFPESRLVFSDLDAAYVRQLADEYKNTVRVAVKKLDVTDARSLAQYRQSFDGVIMLNVLEHLADDRAALHNIYEMLRPGGHAVILVPAYPRLFNALDRTAGHYRRYTRRSLKRLVGRTPFVMKEMFSFNFFAIFGWYVNGSLLGKADLSSRAMKLFDLLVPFFRTFERVILRRKAGISLIIVLEKP